MIWRTVSVAVILAIAQPVSAGYYTSIDMPEETRWSRDYKGVFENVLINLGNISANDLKLGGDSPMRRRYILMETLGRDGTANLKTLEQKLNYSAVLIRRGKAYEATQVLLPLSKEHSNNFLVWSHLATANFLSGNPDFRDKAPLQLEQAISLWPTRMEEVEPALQKYLVLAKLDSDVELERFRKIESYLHKLMRHRVRQDRLAKAGKPLEDGLDPIFLDEDNKDEKKPVRFLSEDGKFEVGRIAPAEKKKLPGDAIEIVEQLLIWMPTDQRLAWLLAEVFNASVADCPVGDERNNMIRSTHRAFKKMDSLENPPSFAPAIRSRIDALSAAAEKLPEPNMIDPKKFGIDIDKPDAGPSLSDTDWWRALGVGFITGLAVGMFAIWQIQEMRRRRHGR